MNPTTPTTATNPKTSNTPKYRNALCHLSAVLSRGVTMEPIKFFKYFMMYKKFIKQNFPTEEGYESNDLLNIPILNKSTAKQYKNIFQNMYYLQSRINEDRVMNDINCYKQNNSGSGRGIKGSYYKNKSLKICFIQDNIDGKVKNDGSKDKRLYICINGKICSRVDKKSKF